MRKSNRPDKPFIQHMNMRDVVLRCVERDTWLDGSIYVKGVWVNIANGEPFIMCKGNAPCIESFIIDGDIYRSEWTESEDAPAYRRRGVKDGDA